MERNSQTNVLANLASSFPVETNLELFRKICDNKYFEREVCNTYHEKKVKMPVFYLSGGSETIPAALSIILKEEIRQKRLNIFAQHRSHGYYLAFGGDPVKLVDELLARPTGCAKGMGGSASIHCPNIGMYGHDGLMGSNIPIAVGYALGTVFERPQNNNKLVLAIAGDAAMEEDYAQAGIAWSHLRSLPVMFICEDNNYSVMTEVEVRRKWKMVDVARAYKLNSLEFSDDPWTIMHYGRMLKETTPSFMNIFTCRQYAHNFGLPQQSLEWDRFNLVKQELNRIGLENAINEIEENSRLRMEDLWKQALQ